MNRYFNRGSFSLLCMFGMLVAARVLAEGIWYDPDNVDDPFGTISQMEYELRSVDMKEVTANRLKKHLAEEKAKIPDRRKQELESIKKELASIKHRVENLEKVLKEN